MSVSFPDLLAQTKAGIEEISVTDLHAQLQSEHAPLVIDIREADELVGGQIPGSKAVPRGFLEMRIDGPSPQ